MHARNSRRAGGGGVDFTLTEDFFLLDPQKPRSSFSGPRLDSQLLIYGALLRHDAHFMMIGCLAVNELFGCTFLPTAAASFARRYARTTGHFSNHSPLTTTTTNPQQQLEKGPTDRSQSWG